MENMEKRGSGILLHISSLPSDYGIGNFGKEAYKFVDFLKESGQKYWQILPLGQTSYGDSPYQSFSTNAGNPYFIDFDFLKEEGLLKEEEYKNIDWGNSPTKVDYEKIYTHRYEILLKAFKRFDQNTPKYLEFLEKEKAWIEDYATFMSIKFLNNGICWNLWKDEYKFRDFNTLKKYKQENKDDIEFWKFIQFKFYEQWSKLKKYANENEVQIIGDIPIYVAYDSVDVWKNPEYFELTEKHEPESVAGVPPDPFSPTGQLWGNPLYNWEYMKTTGYKWWVDRMRSASEIYDVIRIDHFRGFDSFFSIPAKDKTAERGVWKKGPGIELFETLEKELGKLNVIAEDLGFLTPSVIKLLKDSKFPGMKLMQFAFDSREGGDYLPHNYTANSIAYIGTHDNDTGIGWLKTADKKDIEYMQEYLATDEKNKKELLWKIICRTMSTVSKIAIIQMQDYLMLGNEARMNKPSTLGGNWCWRMKKDALTDKLSKKILKITKLYQRV